VAGVMQDRSTLAAQMRVAGHTYDSIGRALGISRQGAYQLTRVARVPVRLRLPSVLVARLRHEYESQQRSQEPTDDDFRAFLSQRLAEVLDE
jgi:hypothetical protein